jgi:hypothetical protein
MLETEFAAAADPNPPQGQTVQLEEIPRSREVGQSYLSSVATTLHSLAFAAWVVLKQRPGLVSGGWRNPKAGVGAARLA